MKKETKIICEKLAHAWARLKENNNFKDWQDKHKHCFLANTFNSAPGMEYGPWQFGFYDPDDKKITAILTALDPEFSEPSEVLESGKKIDSVSISSIKLEAPDAIRLAEEIAANHPKELFVKRLIIFQVIDGVQLWNISFVSQSLNVLNIKINAESGDTIEETISSLISGAFGKQKS